MTRILRYVPFAFLCLCVLIARTAAAPPNIVFVLVDDLGWTDLGCFGSTFYETPHVDRLAAGGMRFTAAYAACPVCSPTRASIMTGRNPQRVGITDYINTTGSNQPERWRKNTRLLPAPYADHLALEERTIAESLHDGGYATFFAGKWHLGGKGFLPSDQGFEINIGGHNAGSPRSYFSPYGNPYIKDGPPGEHLPMRLAAETCRFISDNKSRPFFAYLSFYDVHIPLQAPSKLVEKYEEKAARSNATEPAWGREGDHDVRLLQNHPTYSAMVESMDAAVGIVLDKLDELGLTQNSLVVFTSDNGGVSTSEGHPTSNRPLRAGKGWLYEGGIRVPTIIRWPQIIVPASICATPIISNDYFPTLLVAAERPLEPEHHLDGVSLMPLLRGEPSDEIEQRPIFWDYPHYSNQGGGPAGAIRQGRWKLIEWYDDDRIELFDLQTDEGETQDVSGRYPEVTARMKAMLANWRRDVGAKSPAKNPHFQPQN